MSPGGLNLARRPFVNSRPVARVALLLWLLGLLLLLGNVYFFWNYLAGSEEKRTAIAAGRERIAREQQAISGLEAEVGRLDLERQNEQVEFLNGKIAERTFSWSLLFDRLTEVLPDDVRLTRLAPETGNKRAGTRRAGRRQDGAVPGERVALSIAGESRSDEALLQFVDGLFSHPFFSEPQLASESRSEEGDRISFQIEVGYRPAAGGAPSAQTAEEDAAETAVPAGPPPPVIVEEERDTGRTPT